MSTIPRPRRNYFLVLEGGKSKNNLSSPPDVSEQEPQGGEEEQDDETAPGHRLLRQTMVADGAVAAVFGHVAAVRASDFVEAFHA
jgi:hypothetical protein